MLLRQIPLLALTSSAVLANPANTTNMPGLDDVRIPDILTATRNAPASPSWH